MTLYASLPARRLRQILADVLMVVWAGLCYLAGRAVHDATMLLAAPGRTLAGAGESMRERMLGAGDAVDNIPLIEDRLAEPFRGAAGVGTELEEAGRGLVTAVERTALILGWTSALIPLVIVGLFWLSARVRFVRQASAAQGFIDAAPDLDLFALRAMANQPMPALARISADPAGAWRRSEDAVIRQLAELELRAVGLRAPAPARQAGA